MLERIKKAIALNHKMQTSCIADYENKHRRVHEIEEQVHKIERNRNTSYRHATAAEIAEVRDFSVQSINTLGELMAMSRKMFGALKDEGKVLKAEVSTSAVWRV